MSLNDLKIKYILAVKIFIVIIYSVGITGLLIPATSSLMASLTPVTLLISFALMLLYHEEKFDQRFIIVALALFSAGLLLEMAGVNTGKIFGVYVYGENLGPKIHNTPWMIGLNWVMLSYLTATLSNQWVSNRWLKIIYGAFLMLLYDFFLEQSAPFMDMWTWENDIVPTLNYISWGINALIFQAVWQFSGIRLKNRIALVLFNAMYLFFIILYLIRSL